MQQTKRPGRDAIVKFFNRKPIENLSEGSRSAALLAQAQTEREDIRRLMAHTEVIFVRVGEKREHAARQIWKYDLLALPVLDDREGHGGDHHPEAHRTAKSLIGV